MAKVITALGIITFLFSSNAWAAGLALNPNGWDFGSIVEDTTADKQFTLTNTSNSTQWFIDVDTSGPFSVVSNSCGWSLAKNASCNFTVRFAPTNDGNYSRNLKVDSSSASVQVTVSGRGLERPRLSLSPSSHDYGQLEPDETADKTFTVRNTGGSAATGITFTVSSPFQVASTTCGATLAADASCTVTARFAPTTAGNWNRTLRVQANECSDTSNLEGSARVGAALALTPTGTFGNVIVGQNLSKTFTLTNHGDKSARNLSISVAAPFSITSDNCPNRLYAGDDCQVTVRFSPTVRTAYAQDLTFTYNGGSESFAMTGNGIVKAHLVLSPTAWDFGSVLVGETSDKEFILTNDGDTSATSIGLSVAAPFSVAVNGCGTSLAGNSSCAITLRYAPTAAVTSTKTFTASAGCNSATASLTGTGVTPAFLTVNPTAWDFGSIQVNTNAEQTFLLTNSGGAAAQSLTAATSSPFSVVTSTCDTSLSSGASCSITVRFSPDAAGSFSQNLSFASSANSLAVSLVGVGLNGPQLSFAPSTYDYGTVNVGSSASNTFILTNIGDMEASSISVGTGTPFQITASDCGTALAAGATCHVSVSFSPQFTGVVTENLTATHTQGSAVAALTGNGQVVVTNNPGDVDPTFGDNGITVFRIAGGNLGVSGMVGQADGKIVVAGYWQSTSVTRMAIVRFNPNGTIDTSFATNGVMLFAKGTVDDRLNGLVLQSTGKIVAVGYTYNGTNKDLVLTRLNVDGSLDLTFGAEGFGTLDLGEGDEQGMSVVIDASNRIVVGGYGFVSVENDFLVSRFTEDGVLDTTFNDDGFVTMNFLGGDDRIFAIATDSVTGNIIAGGYGRAPNFRRAMAVARFTGNGDVDTAFNGQGWMQYQPTTGNGQIRGLAMDGEKIVFTGFAMAGSQNRLYLAKLAANGTFDTAFANGGVQEVLMSGAGVNGRMMVRDSQGRFMVVGTDFSTGVQRLSTYRFNVDGSVDVTYGQSGMTSTQVSSTTQDNGFATMVNADGKIISAGTTYDGSSLGLVMVRYAP